MLLALHPLQKELVLVLALKCIKDIGCCIHEPINLLVVCVDWNTRIIGSLGHYV